MQAGKLQISEIVVNVLVTSSMPVCIQTHRGFVKFSDVICQLLLLLVCGVFVFSTERVDAS